MPRRPGPVVLIAVRGAASSVLLYVPEALAVFRETSQRNGRIRATLGAGASARRTRLGFAFMLVWSATIFPLYQVFDDVPGYLIYLRSADRWGAGAAVAICVAWTAALAFTLGVTQARIERFRADLEQRPHRIDDSDTLRYALDAAVMSAPWQVFRRANEPSEPDWTGIPSAHAILGFSLLYSGVNTALYVTAKWLPVGDWTGFVLSLVLVTALGGAWQAMRTR